MPRKSLNILFTGDYLPEYNRTRILRIGLEALGHSVTQFPFKKMNSDTRKQLRAFSRDLDFVFLPSFTHQQVKFVKKTLPDSFLVFDPLISRYLTKVHDYKLVSPYGLSALRNYFRDKNPMGTADFVITDTAAHRDYFHEKFGIPLEKMGTVYIGNDFGRFRPLPSRRTPGSGFIVGFYGGFIPLQGVGKIISAAEQLKDHSDIQFQLIGTGFQYEWAKNEVSKRGLNQVELPGWVEEELLPQALADFDLCLGVFGDGLKSDLVVPNKVYHYLACGRPTISKDSPAMRELFENRRQLSLIDNSPEALANEILRLKSSPEEAKTMGEVGHHYLEANFSAEMVAAKLIQYFEQCLA